MTQDTPSSTPATESTQPTQPTQPTTGTARGTRPIRSACMELVRGFGKTGINLGAGLKPIGDALHFAVRQIFRPSVLVLAGVGAIGYTVYQHPPVEHVARGEAGLRVNQLTGTVTEFRDGAVLVIPGLHEMRRLSLRDQIYQPTDSSSADGPAPFQTVEGLSIGVDVTVRYALDPEKLVNISRNLPEDISKEVVQPAVRGVLYKTLSRYTVRDIFTHQRAQIQEVIESELKPILEKDGIKLNAVLIGKIDLPRDYKAGMERLLSEELATQKMKYTLELKEKQVQQSALEAQAEKARRETQAAAAAEEQIIAAKAQAEAMKHILPFKEKQIQQRALEAEAEKISRLKQAEASSQARQIEATGEAESRRKLADAEAYRQDKLGKLVSEQMARDGALIQKHPLLIQKAMADKLSDKISVIIAPPPTSGGFIGSALLGTQKADSGNKVVNHVSQNEQDNEYSNEQDEE